MDHESRLLEILAGDDQAELRRLLKILLAQFEDPAVGLETD